METTAAPRQAIRNGKQRPPASQPLPVMPLAANAVAGLACVVAAAAWSAALTVATVNAAAAPRLTNEGDDCEGCMRYWDCVVTGGAPVGYCDPRGFNVCCLYVSGGLASSLDTDAPNLVEPGNEVEFVKTSTKAPKPSLRQQSSLSPATSGDSLLSLPTPQPSSTTASPPPVRLFGNRVVRPVVSTALKAAIPVRPLVTQSAVRVVDGDFPANEDRSKLDAFPAAVTAAPSPRELVPQRVPLPVGVEEQLHQQQRQQQQQTQQQQQQQQQQKSTRGGQVRRIGASPPAIVVGGGGGAAAASESGQVSIRPPPSGQRIALRTTASTGAQQDDEPVVLGIISVDNTQGEPLTGEPLEQVVALPPGKHVIKIVQSTGGPISFSLRPFTAGPVAGKFGRRTNAVSPSPPPLVGAAASPLQPATVRPVGTDEVARHPLKPSLLAGSLPSNAVRPIAAAAERDASALRRPQPSTPAGDAAVTAATVTPASPASPALQQQPPSPLRLQPTQAPEIAASTTGAPAARRESVGQRRRSFSFRAHGPRKLSERHQRPQRQWPTATPDNKTELLDRAAVSSETAQGLSQKQRARTLSNPANLESASSTSAALQGRLKSEDAGGARVSTFSFRDTRRNHTQLVNKRAHA